MKYQLTLLLFATLNSGAVLQAQDGLVHGHVRVHAAVGPDTPVPGARVAWSDGIATVTDDNGHFQLTYPSQWPAILVVSSFGTTTDSLRLDGPPTAAIAILLDPSVQLAAAEVVERQASTRLSTRSLQAIEAIGARELKRAACCDVSESFETNATVDVSYSDAVSGTKSIRMLGLDGKYAQISLENIPFVRGLSSSSGITLIPGPWINEINVSKGIGTAVNGPNAMTGQIDLCLLDPATAPALFTNLYLNSDGRTELNVNTAQKMGKAGDNLLMVHGSMLQREMDNNGDGFLDQPLTRRFNIMDRWMQRTEKRTSQVILRYVFDGRTGGQTNAHQQGESPLGKHYVVGIENEMTDVIIKNGWILADPTKSIGILAGFRNNTLSSNYGERSYEGAQRSAYVNVVYQQLIQEKDQIKFGGSFQYDDYDELFSEVPGDTMDLGRTERMPGIFGEYTRTREAFTMVAGLRADFNDLYGTAISPRLHLKYDLAPLTTIRFSVGSGFRTANPLVENASALASSRHVSIADLGMERSWNTGLSLLHKFKWLDKKWTFALDLYRSDFVSQVVADLDRDPQTLAIYMLDGSSYANSLLTDIQVAITKQWDLKLSYRWYDVRTTYDGVLMSRPFVPTHRGLIDLGYNSKNEKWRFDITLNGFGPARLPSTASNPEEFRMGERSPAYATLNAQITHVMGAWEVYIGGENLTGAVQSHQILSAEDPFGPFFDASLIWGPTTKQVMYGGLRFTIPQKTTTKP